MHVLSLEVFVKLNFKNFPLWVLYYIHLLHVLIYEVLTMNRVMNVLRHGLLDLNPFYLTLNIITSHRLLPLFLLVEEQIFEKMRPGRTINFLLPRGDDKNLSKNV